MFEDKGYKNILATDGLPIDSEVGTIWKVSEYTNNEPRLMRLTFLLRKGDRYYFCHSTGELYMITPRLARLIQPDERHQKGWIKNRAVREMIKMGDYNEEDLLRLFENKVIIVYTDNETSFCACCITVDTTQRSPVLRFQSRRGIVSTWYMEELGLLSVLVRKRMVA
jgi:hypothetical protein